MWSGTDEEESVKTIRASVERGITLIDTAPAYGFGRSEEIVGRALADAGLRSRVVIATKVLPTEGHGTKFIGRVPRGGSIVHLPDWKKVGAR